MIQKIPKKRSLYSENKGSHTPLSGHLVHFLTVHCVDLCLLSNVLQSINVMKPNWSDEEAEEYKKRYAKYGDDLALRVYTSRLIGKDSQCKFVSQPVELI